MIKRTSYTFKLDETQQKALINLLRTGNYRPLTVEHTLIAAEGPDCNISLYKSGKCLVQGRGAEEWITFNLEPQVLGEVRLGYEDVLNPEANQPHMGIDESGKGDFFGPMVIAAAYVDETLVHALREMNVRDSKTITSDRKAEEMARDIRKLLGARFALVTVGPTAYNRLYAKMRSVNTILAWGHARAIENLLEKVPDCPRALSDQFGPTHQIQRALLQKGRSIKLEQRHKAESDMAVAAASVLARAGFLDALRKMGEKYGMTIPKGASVQVKAAACELIKKHGPQVLLEAAKCHFKTADEVLTQCGHLRMALGPDGQATSKAFTR
ncbi:MAG TPA: ribonuclease HIII [Verrucomicrobia bacterium]|nr:MAG: ribonuclease HIII [Lentisphaerae bacterium GWF2_57_35]HBA84034.1 ribonuclease HIII [Verrucomicrobiota bacterium]